MTKNPKARFLMCRPDHFGVSYAINPWMDPESWTQESGTLVPASQREWMALHHALTEVGGAIEAAHGVPGIPDFVFTANSAVVLDRKALLARFRHPERQQEEPHVEAAFRGLQARGLIDRTERLPKGVVLEGAGDCVWDQTRNHFWLGYGQRSDVAARPIVEATFGVEAVALELADPRFYHLDTALCALSGGDVLYVPDAFTETARARIAERVAPQQRIEVGMADASRLAANAVCVGNAVVMSACGAALRGQLEERGYRVIVTPLETFLRSGGAAFCLTLRLDNCSASPVRQARVTAA